MLLAGSQVSAVLTSSIEHAASEERDMHARCVVCGVFHYITVVAVLESQCLSMIGA